MSTFKDLISNRFKRINLTETSGVSQITVPAFFGETTVLTGTPVHFNIDGIIIQSTKAQANIDGVIVNLTKAQANIDGVIKTIWVSSV